jgi:hypothetical protein
MNTKHERKRIKTLKEKKRKKKLTVKDQEEKEKKKVRKREKRVHTKEDRGIQTNRQVNLVYYIKN